MGSGGTPTSRRTWPREGSRPPTPRRARPPSTAVATAVAYTRVSFRNHVPVNTVAPLGRLGRCVCDSKKKRKEESCGTKRESLTGTIVPTDGVVEEVSTSSLTLGLYVKFLYQFSV